MSCLIHLLGTPIHLFSTHDTGVLHAILTGKKPEQISHNFKLNKKAEDIEKDYMWPIMKENSSNLAVWLIKNLNIKQKNCFVSEMSDFSAFHQFPLKQLIFDNCSTCECTPFISPDELPIILAEIILPNLRTTFDTELVKILQSTLLLLQCRNYDPYFQEFYQAAEDFLLRVMSHKTYSSIVNSDINDLDRSFCEAKRVQHFSYSILPPC